MSCGSRRYATARSCVDGTYVITRRRPRGEWQAWVILTLYEGTKVVSAGWHGVRNSEPYRFAPNAYPTFRAARVACEQHNPNAHIGDLRAAYRAEHDHGDFDPHLRH